MFTLIKDINMSKTEWTLKLRIVRCYEKTSWNNRKDVISLECVFHDFEGYRINGTIRKNHMHQFQPVFKEGHVYALRDFIVALNGGKYKTPLAKYKIIFHGRTRVFEIFDNSFPNHIYCFKSFADLANLNLKDESMLFDVIGRVVGMQSAQNRQLEGRDARFIEITLEDLENNQLKCTLWEELVDCIVLYLNNQDLEPLVVIIQLCRAQAFRDVVKVSNTFDTTKLIIDNNVEEISDFLSSLRNKNQSPRPISYASAPSANNDFEELSKGDVTIYTIDQLLMCGEVGSFWMCAVIESFTGNYWYVSCRKCPKKLTRAGTKFYCERCDNFYESGNLRYRIQLEVSDGTGSTALICWDKDCETLIGKTCAALRMELNNTDEFHVPEEIAALFNRKVLFKVQKKADQLSNFTRPFSVVKTIDDQSLVSKYCCFQIESQESSDDNEVNTPEKLKRKKIVLEDMPAKRELFEDMSSCSRSKKVKDDISIV